MPRNRLCMRHDALRTDALQAGGVHAFCGTDRRPPPQQAPARDREQVARLEQGNTIQEKATAYCTSASKRGAPGSTDTGTNIRSPTVGLHCSPR